MNRPQSPAIADQVAGPSEHSVQGGQGKLSFAERRAQKSHASLARIIEGDHLIRNVDRPLPGDVVRRARKSNSKPDLGKQRSNLNFFEDAFAVNGSHSAKERVYGDAIVMAEVKTNVIVNDEFSFITELSYHLSTRYQRPVSSIVVTIQHGACMFFGGSFDPAYVISIFALPTQLLPTTNKRNAALVQKHMEEAIGVSPARGFLRFVPTSEENLACNGKTIAGEIEELEKNYGVSAAAPTDDAKSNLSRRGSARKKLSMKSFANFRPSADVSIPELTPPTSADEAFPASSNAEENAERTKVDLPKTAKRRKSFVANIFNRSAAKSENRWPLPTIPTE
ncbi:Tautomerase/MIF superfamily [Podospora didyma]|uniref:L-dopachrome isomerase n=1 Tax=Podospora didyma TaxID=330526 RepID=A0AAE0KE59_9PEZI|nr:Tautomerase/MIF superfamily [Podospora didyma]